MTDRTTRRRVLRLSGTALLGTLAGCTGWVDDGSESETQTTPERTSTRTETATATQTTSPTQMAEPTRTETTEADRVVVEGDDVEVPTRSSAADVTPRRPADHRYATMGDDDADVTATVYGNWKCPYTAEFVTGQFDEIAEQYVEPGDLRLRFRAVAYRNGDAFLGPDAPRAARAGLAVWNRDPDAYWSYFSTVFANQPSEGEEWATTGQLTTFADVAGVRNAAKLAQGIESERHAKSVAATVETVTKRDIYSVPRLAVGDTVVAPTRSPEATTALLDEVTK